MGWRERDWARFNRHERRAFFGDDDVRHAPARLRSGFGRGAVNRNVRVVVVCAGGAVIGVLAAVHRVPDRAMAATRDVAHFAHERLTAASAPVHEASSARRPASGQFKAPAQPPRRPHQVSVSIRWRTSDVAPARVGGRICLTPRARRQVCATYVVGERPADNLTRRLRALGYRVESAGG